LRISRASAGASALALALLAAGGAALAQQKPESILPPGFDQPPAPAPAPRPTPRASTPAPTQAAAPATVAAPSATPSSAVTVAAPAAPAPVATDPVTGLPIAAPLPTATPGQVRYTLPESSRRDLAMIGILPTAERMLNPAAFGNADGRYIEALMHGTRAPIASHWVSIALRRLLLQPIATPRNVNGADFAAERAWLLLRMGESVAARAMVQSVDPQDYTPKLYQVALQAALATGDVGAMCPLANDAVKVSSEPGWILARGMCASLSSTPSTAAPLMNQAKRVAAGIDLALAQKIAGRGSNKGDMTIEWDGVTNINSWRYGLAMAAGEDIPDALFDDTGPQMRYWQVLAPQATPVRRSQFADQAAAQGILSNLALVDLYGLIDAGDDQGNPANAVAGDLRTAYSGGSRDVRLGALRSLWGQNSAGLAGYGRLVLTARAAQRIPIAAKTDGSDQLIASMLSAGLDRSASRWRGAVARGSLGWALILVSDPDSNARYGSGDVGAFSADAAKQRMFAAGLAGLGRLDASVAQSYGADVQDNNSWTRAIDRAAAEGRPGEVLVLSAVGLQTQDWRGVSPAALFHIVNALRAVGLGSMARMVAAEAVTRA
jgi:hypothetical protein